MKQIKYRGALLQVVGTSRGDRHVTPYLKISVDKERANSPERELELVLRLSKDQARKLAQALLEGAAFDGRCTCREYAARLLAQACPVHEPEIMAS
jgi:hypothetical protein